MAELMAVAPIISAAASAGAGGMGIFGALQQGAAAKAAGEYQNTMDRRQGDAALAQQERAGLNKALATDANESKFRNLASASGGGVGDTPSIAEIYGNLAAMGNTQEREEVDAGLAARDKWRNQGTLAQWGGNVAQQGDYWKAAGIGLDTAGKLAKGSSDTGAAIDKLFH